MEIGSSTLVQGVEILDSCDLLLHPEALMHQPAECQLVDEEKEIREAEASLEVDLDPTEAAAHEPSLTPSPPIHNPTPGFFHRKA